MRLRLYTNLASQGLPRTTPPWSYSLSESVIPDDLKQANMCPLVKKHSLDTGILNTYFSETAMVQTKHVTGHNVHGVMQASTRNTTPQRLPWFRPSMWLDIMYTVLCRPLQETPLHMVHLHNDILSALDDNKAVIMLCIDLSAAFDRVNHSILQDKSSEMNKRNMLHCTRLVWIAEMVWWKTWFFAFNTILIP